MRQSAMHAVETGVRNKRQNRMILLFAAAIFLLETAYGVYLGYFEGVLLNDAFSRTANAFYVLFVKPVRYASIGLVWNPLPSTLQLPFMALAKFWRPIASSGIAAAITTAIFAACTAVILLKTFLRMHMGKGYSFLLVLLYVLNPFTFFYGSNGMSESIFFLFMAGSVCAYVLWKTYGAQKYIVYLAFSFAGMFFTRYEAIPFAAAMAVAAAVNILSNPNEAVYWTREKRRERYRYVEGTLIVLFTPLLYAVALWILFNWAISGNPLYFLNSVYSNVSQSTFAREYGTIAQVFQYALSRTVPFSPLFLAILALRVLQKKLLRYDTLEFLALSLVLFFFHCLMLYMGSSYGWLRFFSPILPVCVAWIPYEIYHCKPNWRNFSKAVIAVALIVSAGLCGWALQDDDLAKEEKTVTISQEAGKIAAYINNTIPEDRVLMDAFLTGGIILNVDNVDNLVVSSSLDFEDCLADPVHRGINYLLVPSQDGVGNLDAVNIQYPSLYEDGAEWCELAAEFDGFKLYRVLN